jgi:hypothetical protein
MFSVAIVFFSAYFACAGFRAIFEPTPVDRDFLRLLGRKYHISFIVPARINCVRGAQPYSLLVKLARACRKFDSLAANARNWFPKALVRVVTSSIST